VLTCLARNLRYEIKISSLKEKQQKSQYSMANNLISKNKIEKNQFQKRNLKKKTRVNPSLLY
jgi:hypothetical protein